MSMSRRSWTTWAKSRDKSTRLKTKHRFWLQTCAFEIMLDRIDRAISLFLSIMFVSQLITSHKNDMVVHDKPEVNLLMKTSTAPSKAFWTIPNKY
jgi:hypothetical protein